MFAKITLFILALSLSFVSCPPRRTIASRQAGRTVVTHQSMKKPVKNIVLMIGDGMGITQITAGLYSNNNHLSLERCKSIGLHKSYSSSKLTTDSAAGATAFSTGHKTYNGTIGVNDQKQALPTILEQAEQKGLATGLVVTSTIGHATPAAFYAHVPKRSMYEDIAPYLVHSGVDFFVGGGEKHFTQRKDRKNLLDDLRKKNYVIKRIQEEKLDNINPDPSRGFGYFTGTGDPKTYRQGRRYLPVATKKALQYLSRHKGDGFFLMVEGSQIDWGGHANDSQYIIEEMLDFDKAVAAALDFAQADGETLVIITADHETGGYAIMPDSKVGAIDGKFSTDYHTPDLIPVFAFGPGAESFGGIYENTAIYDKMVEAFGWK